MNNTVLNEMNSYEDNDIKTLEKAILAENVTFTGLEPIKAKFFVPSTTPGVETVDAKTKNAGKYSQSNYIDLVISPQILLMFMNPKFVPIESIKHNPSKCNAEGCTTLNHTSSNCKYILGFTANKFIIPKGTEFLIGYLGGLVEIDKIAIIGVYSLTTSGQGDSIGSF